MYTQICLYNQLFAHLSFYLSIFDSDNGCSNTIKKLLHSSVPCLYTSSMNFFRHAVCPFELRASVASQNAHIVQLAGQHRRLNATTHANGVHH